MIKIIKMLNDKKFMKLITNDQIRTVEYPDYQNIFINLPDQLLENQILYFNTQYELSNRFRFTLKNDEIKNNQTIKKNLKTFNRFYNIRDMFISHFQLHNVIKFFNNTNVLYTSEDSIDNLNLIKGEKTKMFSSIDSKYLDYNKKANMIVSNDKEKAVIFNLETKSKLENIKFYDNDDLLGRMVFFERENSDPFLTAVGNHKKIILWDIKKKKNFSEIEAQTYVNDVGFIEEKNSFIFAMDTIEIMSKDMRDNKSTLFFIGHNAHNFSVCKIDENFFATSGEDGKTIIWDFRKNDQIFKEYQSEKPVYSVKYNKEKTLLACLQSGMQIDLIDIGGEIFRKDEIKFSGIATGIDFNENGTKLAVGVSEVFCGLMIFDV